MFECGLVQRKHGIEQSQRTETAPTPFAPQTQRDFLRAENRIFFSPQKKPHIAQANLAAVEARGRYSQPQSRVGGADRETQKRGGAGVPDESPGGHREGH